MATGTTYDFEASRDEIIVDALANVGAAAPDQDIATIDGRVRSHAARLLNNIVKSRDADGLYLWRVVRRTFTTTAATATYIPAADVLAIDEPMNYKPAATTDRTPLVAMSRDEFMSLSGRTQAGRPSQYFLEKTLAQPVTVTVWPVPDTTGDSIEYAAVLRSLDFDTGANTPDFPQRFTRALTLSLSAELAPTYGGQGQLQLASYFNKRAEEEWGKQISLETEHGNVQLVPYGGR